MGCNNSKEKQVFGYYSTSNELILFEKRRTHKPRKQYDFVHSHDTKFFSPNDEVYLLSAIWHDDWLKFVLARAKEAPSSIDNNILLNEDRSRLKSNLRPKHDFRPINKTVWEYFFNRYGGGPVITFSVPAGYTEEDYMKGTWIKRIELDKAVSIIFPCVNPSSDSQRSVTVSVSNPMAEANSEIAANLLLRDLGKAKFQQAKEVQKEINATNAEMIGAMMAKDLGKAKLEEAKEKDKEATKELSGAIAHQFQEELSKKKREEAKQAQKKAEESEQVNVASIFAKGSLKKQMREAIANKNDRLAEEIAALMLQNAWKGRKARRRVQLMKMEKQRLLEEACARKLQSRYRARLAQQRVKKLRAEKQRLKEEGCAIILQSNWRIKKARDKVKRLKAEKQRLLEEGAALRLQSAWRIKQAKQKVNYLKLERERKRQEEERQRIRSENAQRVIAQYCIMLLAKIRYRKMLMSKPKIVIVTLHSAHDINIADATSSDPYVVVHSEAAPQLQLSTAKPSTASPLKRSGSSTASGEGKTISAARTKIIYNTLNPVWNEDCIAIVHSSNDQIALTMIDKDTFSNDDFLGQSVLDLKKFPKIFSGQTVRLRNLDIGNYLLHLKDGKGKAVHLGSMDIQGKGQFDVSIRLAQHSRSCFGWMQRLGSQSFGFGAASYKPRFFVLVNGFLNYYEDELALEKPRGSIPCSEITAINYGPDKSGETTLIIKQGAKEEWAMHWMEHESEDKKREWLRKLQFNCPSISINQRKGSFVERTESTSSRTLSTSGTVEVKHTSKVVRRASNILSSSK